MNTYDLVTLLGVVNGLTPDHQFLLNLCFRQEVNFDTPEIMMDKVQKSRKLAPFVSPLVAGVVRTQDGYSTDTFAPAYVKPKDLVDPKRVMTRLAGEAISGDRSPQARRDSIVADILLEHRSGLERRLEWMAAQILRTGAVTIEGENYPAQVVDFGRDANNTVTLLTTSRWNDSAPTVVDDIEAWSGLLDAPADNIVMGAAAWQSFRKQQEVKDLLDTRRGSTAIAELAPSNGSMVQHKGNIGGVDYWVYTGTYEDDAGTEQLFLGTNEVLVVSSGAFAGTQAFGAILSPSAGYQPMKFYPRNWISQEVELEYVESQSAPLLIPGRANSSLLATVQ